MSGGTVPEDAGPDRRAARLIEPNPRLGVPIPAYGGASVGNLAVSLLRALGGSSGEAPALLPGLEGPLEPWHGGAPDGPVVVVLLDGFGWRSFERWSSGPSERGRRWRACAAPITTVFPTTTTSALTSLSTGTAPSTHGLVGYRQYLPAYGAVIDMLKMAPVAAPTPGGIIGPSWQPRMVSGAPTIFRRGVAATILSRWQFAGTGFTRLLYDGAEYLSYGSASDQAEELRRLLDRASPPLLTYTYWDELDTVQHLKGPEPALVEFELDRFAGLLEFVARGISAAARRRTTVLITGDHGQVPASREARLEIESIPSVAREMLRPLGGDRRAGLFAARPGRLPALREALEAILPSGSRIIPVPSAITEGLFGPPPAHPELLERLGDLVVLVPPPAGLTYRTPGGGSPERFLFGAHGGLDPEELLVPLVRGSLEQLTGLGA